MGDMQGDKDKAKGKMDRIARSPAAPIASAPFGRTTPTRSAMPSASCRSRARASATAAISTSPTAGSRG